MSQHQDLLLERPGPRGRGGTSPNACRSLMEAGFASRNFIRLDVGEVRLVGRMSVFGPVIVGRVRDYTGGDLGWMYLGPHGAIRAVDTLDMSSLRGKLGRRPWSDVDLRFCLCRHFGQEPRIPLPAVTEDQAALISRVFGIPFGGAATPVKPQGLWLAHAARWMRENPASADKYRDDGYFQGWVAAADAAARVDGEGDDGDLVQLFRG